MPRRATLLTLALLICASAAAADTPHADRVAAPAASATEGRGFVPPAVAGDHLADGAAKALQAAKALRPDKALPAAFDCRVQGWVSPVKNQGVCGACYAFSSAGDLESKILRQEGVLYDLSEDNMKECNYQASSCDGGNQYMIMNHLSAAGAVAEACDPYTAANVSCAVGCEAQFTVLDWSAISGGTIPATDVLKQYLMDHGPLQTTLYAGDAADMAWYSSFSSYDGNTTLYYPAVRTPNHSVLLVGWDDGLAHAGGTGAWIVKNSWGTNWGGTCGYGSEGGYFRIAYGSASIGMWSSFVGEFMPADPSVSLLRHDEGGYSAAWGGIGTALWGMARHDVTQTGFLHRVEFWTTDATTDVDVYVYDGFSGGALTGLLASSLNNAFSEAGYHHVEFSTPVAVTAGQDLYVAVRFTDVSYQYPVAVDMDGPAAADRSWYSVNGTSWTSLYGPGADVTIRARTSTDAVLSVDGDGPDDVPDAGPAAARLELDEARPNPFNPSTNISFRLPRDGRVLVSLYDLQGRTVRTLLDATRTAGEHQLVWDGRDDAGLGVPSGVYFCLVEAHGQVRGIKLALLK